MIDELLQDAREHMDKSVEATRQKFQSVRAGRANPSLLESPAANKLALPIRTRYFGAARPLAPLICIRQVSLFLKDSP